MTNETDCDRIERLLDQVDDLLRKQPITIGFPVFIPPEDALSLMTLLNHGTVQDFQPLTRQVAERYLMRLFVELKSLDPDFEQPLRELYGIGESES